MKYVKDVWILIASNPTQPVELKRSVSYVGKKSSRLEAANVERNPHLAQLLLHHRHHQPCALCGGSLHGDVETHAVREGIARRIEQRASFIGVVIICRHVAVVGPTLRRKNAARRLRLPAPQILDHRTAVDRVGDGLPDPHIFQYGIAQIESQILDLGAWGTFDRKGRFALEREHGVWREEVAGDVTGSFAQFEGRGRRVGHYRETTP